MGRPSPRVFWLGHSTSFSSVVALILLVNRWLLVDPSLTKERRAEEIRGWPKATFR